HDEADADRAAREANARRRLNPFRFGERPEDITSFPEPILCDWVLEAGLEPPEEPATGNRDWAGWSAALGGRLTPRHRARMWEACNRLRFYAVEERPDVPVGYAVVKRNLHSTDRGRVYTGSEGGTIHKVYRTRLQAEEEARNFSFESHQVRNDWFPS